MWNAVALQESWTENAALHVRMRAAHTSAAYIHTLRRVPSIKY